MNQMLENSELEEKRGEVNENSWGPVSKQLANVMICKWLWVRKYFGSVEVNKSRT